MFKQLSHLARCEDGSEILEYVLVAGLVIAGCVALVGVYGTRVMARWGSISSSI